MTKKDIRKAFKTSGKIYYPDYHLYIEWLEEIIQKFQVIFKSEYNKEISLQEIKDMQVKY